MKKPNLSLKTRPFKKVSDDLNTEVKHFHELITKVVKKNPLQYEQPLLDALEAELAKCKDGIETWIKANALEQLGYTDFASKFKEKATELGYSVDHVMESMDPTVQVDIDVKYNGRVIDTFKLPSEIWKKLKAEYSSTLEGKKIKLISIKENVENIESGEQGTITNHDTEADIISVKWDNGKESTILPEDEFEVIPNETNETKIQVNAQIRTSGGGTYNDFIVNVPIDTTKPNWLKNPENESILKDAIHSQHLGNSANTYPTEIISAKIVENLVLNPEQGKNQMMLQDTTTLNNGEPTSATKQEIEGVPEYNKSALVSLILSDPFLNYSFHATTTDDQDADLEKFYKHYIKGDEKMERMLDVYTQNVAPKNKNLKPFNGANADTN